MSEPSRPSEDVVILDSEVVSDRWGVLSMTTLERSHRDGSRHTEKRETYDSGDSATILLYDRTRRMVLLVRQFRFAAFANGHPDGMLIEAAAGRIDPGEDGVSAIRREAVEELGVEIGELEHLYDAYVSPGADTERAQLFAAAYTPETQTGPGGGLAEEGEDIEVLELAFDEALAMTTTGAIVDATTILLLQWAALRGPFARA